MPKLHVDDLFERIRQYHRDVRLGEYMHSYMLIKQAQTDFKAWCAEKGLDLDFTDRTEYQPTAES